MSALVLWILLNESGKRDKMRGFEACRAFYLFFATSFNKLKNKSTNVRFYLSYDIKNTFMSRFSRKLKNVIILHYVRTLLWTTSGLSILLHGVISLPGATLYDKRFCGN